MPAKAPHRSRAHDRAIAYGETLRRSTSDTKRNPLMIQTPRDAAQILIPCMQGLMQEIFVVLALDARNRLVAQIEVARGTLTGVEVHPREVFRPLIVAGAAGFIVSHNHPSGDPTPSPEDVLLTRRLRECGELLGVPLLDHVVIAGEQYRSVAEGLL